MSTNENSAIEWTHYTFNPWRGCTKVSAGCKNCYAETLSGRNPKALGVWGPRGRRVIAAEDYWRFPLKWNKKAERAGERYRVFCASLADVFEGPDTMPAADWVAVQAARKRLVELITLTPHLDWLLVTKRPQNALPMLVEAGLYAVENPALPCPQPNIWIGVSVEDQDAADERIPKLLKVPAVVRFLSCEPLLGPLNLERIVLKPAEYPERGEPPVSISALNGWYGGAKSDERTRIDWVIAGGESGKGEIRPMHPNWVRAIRDQCAERGVPFLFKQWGEWIGGEYDRRKGKFVSGAPHDVIFWTNPDHPPLQLFDVKDAERPWWRHAAARVGKKKAGRLLDGVIHDAFPTPQPSNAPTLETYAFSL